jgi:hypothetical protein
MKSPKKTTKSEGPGKKFSKSPVKEQNKLTDPKELNRPLLDEDDDFDIPLDEDIQDFDSFDDDDDGF